MKVRWIVLAIVVVALAPKPVQAFCQGVVNAAVAVVNDLGGGPR